MPGHSTVVSAAAGCSRAARQLPIAPAISAPARASATAATTAVAVTGAPICTATVWNEPGGVGPVRTRIVQGDVERWRRAGALRDRGRQPRSGRPHDGGATEA